MWTRVLRATYIALTIKATDSATLKRTGLLLTLVETLENLQSQPDEFAAEAQRSIDGADLGGPDPRFLTEICARVRDPEPLTAAEWLMLTSLGELAEILESGWRRFYEPISHGYPDLALKLQTLRTTLQPVPFAAALGKLSHEWPVGNDRIFDRIAVAFIRVCAMMGSLDATGDVYHHVAMLLSFECEFLSVWMAGSCLKLQSIAGSIDLSELSEEQYACMRMLDQFSSLQGIPWG